MGKRKARGSQHRDGNQTSGGGLHGRKIHAVSAAANCNRFYSATASFDGEPPVKHCEAHHFRECNLRTVTDAFGAKNRAKSYLIFARMSSISFRRKARSV